MSYYNELRRVVQASQQDAKKRKKEKQAQGIDRGQENPFEKLIIEGRACQIHKDRIVAASIETSLVPCHGRKDTMIDRFDGRALLESLPQEKDLDDSSAKDIEAGDYKLDSFLSYERYRDLIEAARRGIDQKGMLKSVAYEVRLRLQRGFGSETAEEVHRREERIEREKIKEAIRDEKRRRDQVLAESIAAAAAGVSGHYGPALGPNIAQIYPDTLLVTPPACVKNSVEQRDVHEEFEGKEVDVLTPQEVDARAEEYGVRSVIPGKGYTYMQLDLYDKKQELLDAEPEVPTGTSSRKERRRYRRSDDFHDSLSDSNSDSASKPSFREFKDPTAENWESHDSDSDSNHDRRESHVRKNDHAVEFFTGFDVVVDSQTSKNDQERRKREENSELSHLELLDGFFPALGNAVRTEEARLKRRLQKKREARERRELQQWRARLNRSRSRDRTRRNCELEKEDEPVPEPPPDPKKTAAVAITAAKVAGKKLTPAELVKLRMRHMMAATIQQDRHENRKKKDAAAKEAELEIQAQKVALEARKNARKVYTLSDTRSRSVSRSMSMSISSFSSPERDKTGPDSGVIPPPPPDRSPIRSTNSSPRDRKRNKNSDQSRNRSRGRWSNSSSESDRSHYHRRHRSRLRRYRSRSSSTRSHRRRNSERSTSTSRQKYSKHRNRYRDRSYSRQRR